MSTPEQTNTPLKSTLSNDPDMVELVQFFVDEMSDRAESIRAAADENDLGRLRVVAHQLKGSGAGYGFEPISNAADAVEQLIDTQAEADNLRAQVDELINLCRRASV